MHIYHFKFLRPLNLLWIAGFISVALIILSCTKTTSEPIPYPLSSVIAKIHWSPVPSINRYGKGSDLWPITWAGDDRLYTAWGDGWGFHRQDGPKLSMGIGYIEGIPPEIRLHDIFSPSIESTGNSRKGLKPSSLLMVNGKLYMWLRNIDRQGNGSRLAISEDAGRTWVKADWSFDEFGYCVFLNFGRNYEQTRDKFVYVYSPNGKSAYSPADEMVLLRVLRHRILNRQSYEFFSGFEIDGSPIWSYNAVEKQAVFRHPGECLRSSISFNPGLKRYLWWQLLPSSAADARFEGGFAIYDAPEPWGPWTTAFFTRKWDTGPGETAAIPTKWISEEGKDFYLVFSGEDALSIRHGQFKLFPKVEISQNLR